MGRHMMESSPLRSPAVVFGVPVATVLATMGSNAMLGGVFPSAEETPLHAESPAATPVDALPGPAASPSSWSPSATEGIVDAAGRDSADAGLADRPQGPGEDTASGTIRVVEVPDDSTARPAMAPRAEGLRVVREGPERAAERGDDLRPEVRDEGDERAAPVAAEPLSSGSPSSRSLSSRSGSPIEPVSTASVVPSDRAGRSDGSDDEDEDTVVDLDTPADGLSVLSFG